MQFTKKLPHSAMTRAAAFYFSGWRLFAFWAGVFWTGVFKIWGYMRKSLDVLQCFFEKRHNNEIMLTNVLLFGAIYETPDLLSHKLLVSLGDKTELVLYTPKELHHYIT